jgi:hypothetical protein
LLAIYEQAPNTRADLRGQALRPLWDGSERQTSYQYLIGGAAPT